MPTETRMANDHDQIREVIGNWTKDISRTDLEGAIACLGPNILSFNLASPLQHEGLSATRKGLEEWFPTWKEPIGLEVQDLRLMAEGHVAFCTSLQHIRGTKTNGAKPDPWFRSTICLQKIDGSWRITQEHTSRHFTWMKARERR